MLERLIFWGICAWLICALGSDALLIAGVAVAVVGETVTAIAGGSSAS